MEMSTALPSARFGDSDFDLPELALEITDI
jgi:hypothetical protein